MNKKNYNLIMEKTIDNLDKRPRLLIHACCAPCSSYVMKRLAEDFSITMFFYNPNIDTQKEYEIRKNELIRLVSDMGYNFPVICEEFVPEDFYSEIQGYEGCEEGGERCGICYGLRLEKTAQTAAELAFDYFATTLTISPMKDAQRINDIGEKLAEKYGVNWLYSDFKKRDGYKESIALSQKYKLYRQDYCGCVYSVRDSL